MLIVRVYEFKVFDRLDIFYTFDTFDRFDTFDIFDKFDELFVECIVLLLISIFYAVITKLTLPQKTLKPLFTAII